MFYRMIQTSHITTYIQAGIVSTGSELLMHLIAIKEKIITKAEYDSRTIYRNCLSLLIIKDQISNLHSNHRKYRLEFLHGN